jgi:hypothetical protein
VALSSIVGVVNVAFLVQSDRAVMHGHVFGKGSAFFIRAREQLLR